MSWSDTVERAKWLKSKHLSDRDFAVHLLQQQAVTSEAAEAIAAWSDEQLLSAVRFYAVELEELPDVDPASLDLPSFRAVVVAEHTRRDDELRELFSSIELPSFDTSALKGIDFSKFAPSLGLSDEAMDALTRTNITFDQLESLLPKVSPDLLKGLTDTSAIDESLRWWRPSIAASSRGRRHHCHRARLDSG